jgi:hypothetical protein
MNSDLLHQQRAKSPNDLCIAPVFESHAISSCCTKDSNGDAHPSGCVHGSTRSQRIFGVLATVLAQPSYSVQMSRLQPASCAVFLRYKQDEKGSKTGLLCWGASLGSICRSHPQRSLLFETADRSLQVVDVSKKSPCQCNDKSYDARRKSASLKLIQDLAGLKENGHHQK